MLAILFFFFFFYTKDLFFSLTSDLPGKRFCFFVLFFKKECQDLSLEASMSLYRVSVFFIQHKSSALLPPFLIPFSYLLQTTLDCLQIIFTTKDKQRKQVLNVKIAQIVLFKRTTKSQQAYYYKKIKFSIQSVTVRQLSQASSI